MVTLQLQGVGALYGRNLVLRDICTPMFRAGEMVAVVGPNAAGKSTLFKRMAGLIKGPGTLLLTGARRADDGICYMPQDSSGSARLTLFESILLARKQRSAGWTVRDDDLHPVDEIIANLGLQGLSLHLLSELSGGQRQLAAIGQTLARDPEIVLMDEPTSALDLHRQIQVLQFMRELADRRGLIVFIALHDLNQALRFFDQVVVLAHGSQQGSGACADVINPGLLRRVWGVDARIEACSRGIRQVVVDGVVSTA